MHRPRSTSGLIHYVALRDLKPSTQYYYTIGDPTDPSSLCATILDAALPAVTLCCLCPLACGAFSQGHSHSGGVSARHCRAL